MIKRVALTALILGLLVVMLQALTPVGASTESTNLVDPRATTYPPSRPGVRVVKADGAQFALWVSFAPEWPTLGLEWQDLWTKIQWQDPLGDWYDVESDDGTMAWQGTLDYVDEESKAWKVWWVDPPDYGRGPFRWLILDHEGGEVLVTTETFYLPSTNNIHVIVEATIPEQ
jgi:hypothetical protein